MVNGGDRPVQVGSHYHFAEANPALLFDRFAAHGNGSTSPQAPLCASNQASLAVSRWFRSAATASLPACAER